MEALSKIKAVVVDKTGTITKGDFKVQTTPTYFLIVIVFLTVHNPYFEVTVYFPTFNFLIEIVATPFLLVLAE